MPLPRPGGEASSRSDSARGEAEFGLDRVYCLVGMSRWIGRLSVDADTVSFRPTGQYVNSMNIEDTPATLVQRDRTITVVVGRLLPPFMNSGVVIADSTGPARRVGVIRVAAWRRRRFVKAATVAGFSVEVHRTCFSSGDGIGSISELERFRRTHTKSPPSSQGGGRSRGGHEVRKPHT